MKNKKSKSLDKAFTVICPRCSVWAGKPCKHTGGDKKGKIRNSPHPDRIRLASVVLPASLKEKIKKGAELPENPKEKKLKTAKSKLTSEQTTVVETILEHVQRLGKHAEFVGPVTTGPRVETYRFLPLQRTKVAHLEALRKDVAVALGATDVFIKRMPGEQAVGFTFPIPEEQQKKIDYRDTLATVVEYMLAERAKEGKVDDWNLPIPLNFGVDADGTPFVEDLVKLPHILTAGTTGGGKSTWMRGALQSIFWTLAPDELQAVICDTKGTEFKHFTVLPHVIGPDGIPMIARDRFDTMKYFDKAIVDTDHRLKTFATENVTNIHEYNAKQSVGKKMPYRIIVIDELADLMGTAIEKAEARMNSDKLSAVVARSRAAGIFVIAATQRPDVKQVKGAIKANFPARLSFKLPSTADSKTILNTKGAEALMKRGDMLYSSSVELKRLHSPFLTLDDSKDMVKSILQRYSLKEEAPKEVTNHDAPGKYSQFPVRSIN